MEKTLRQHISELDRKVKALREAIKDESLSTHQKLKIQINLRFSERFDLYRRKA